MNTRLRRSGLGLVAVVVVYSFYAALAVPFVDPPPPPPKPSSAGGEADDVRKAFQKRYGELFAAYFPPGHWAHDFPKVIESDQAMVLIKDYKPLGRDRVELVPCVMLLFPKRAPDGSAPRQGAVVLDVPQGAELQFEGGFDLSQIQIGRLSRGQLRGEITIYSGMEQPGPEDDLRITTRDVFLTDTRVWTDAEVEFRLGRNGGRGRRMEIRLLPGGKGPAGINVSGIQSFQLAQNVQMHLELEGEGLIPGKKITPSASNPSESPKQVNPAAAQTQNPPLEVKCRGPFHFDLVRYVATFEDQVDVLRLNPSGPSDQLTCELLSVHFEPRSVEKGENRRPLGPLQATKLAAQGSPVIVHSPSTGAHARCQKLEYDLARRKISLESPEARDEVVLFQGSNEIHAPAVQYTADANPRGLGTMWASGPGWLRWQSEEPGDGAPRRFEARWGEQLHLRREHGEQLVSLHGRPQLELTDTGRLIADEIHLWLHEPDEKTTSSSPGGMGGRARPNRMRADGKVLISSSQLTAQTKHLGIWFAETPIPGAPMAAAPLAAQNTAPSGNVFSPASTGQPSFPPRPPSSAAPAVARENKPPEGQHYAIVGDEVLMQVRTGEGRPSVSDVTVNGKVEFRETTLARPDEKGLLIQGDQLQLAGADTPALHATVSGKPGHVEARGLALEGGAIQLVRDTNRVWVDGPGTMRLPMRRGLAGEPLPGERNVDVAWQGNMQFDGRCMRFLRQIEVRAESGVLQTEELEVELTQRIDFSQTVRAEGIEVHQIVCRQGVKLENRTVEGGRQISIDRMQATDLILNQTTGQIASHGRGWVTSVRLGGGDPIGLPNGQRPQAPASRKPAEDRLQFLRIDFNQGIDGNQKQKQIAFLGDVRCIYGPVPNWETVLATEPVALGPEEMTLHCDRLEVTQMNSGAGGNGTLELEALGNGRVEGQTFNAQAHRLTYAQAKDLIVLEGNGRTNAHLYRQEVVGGPVTPFVARKISYSRSTGKADVDGFQFLDVLDTPQPDKKR